jgi:G3E family GTPase
LALARRSSSIAFLRPTEHQLTVAVIANDMGELNMTTKTIRQKERNDYAPNSCIRKISRVQAPGKPISLS